MDLQEIKKHRVELEQQLRRNDSKIAVLEERIRTACSELGVDPSKDDLDSLIDSQRAKVSDLETKLSKVLSSFEDID